MKRTSTPVNRHAGTFRSYTTGFVLSLLLTAAAYLSVTHGLTNSRQSVIIGVVSALALVQLLVQLVYFLHLAGEGRPRWKLLVLVYMVGVAVIVVGGSLWIMDNLNYHMLTPSEVTKYMDGQDGL